MITLSRNMRRKHASNVSETLPSAQMGCFGAVVSSESLAWQNGGVSGSLSSGTMSATNLLRACRKRVRFVSMLCHQPIIKYRSAEDWRNKLRALSPVARLWYRLVTDVAGFTEAPLTMARVMGRGAVPTKPNSALRTVELVKTTNRTCPTKQQIESDVNGAEVLAGVRSWCCTHHSPCDQ